MKLLLTLFLFFNYLFATELDKKEKYLIDMTNTLTIENILQNKNSFKKVTRYSFGIFEDTIWLNLKLKNNTSKTIKKRVFNKIPAIDYVEVYIFKNSKIIKTYKLGDKLNHQQRDNLSRIPYFDISLDPLENIEIFIKQKTIPPMDIKWDIIDINSFEKTYKINNMIYFIIVGIFIFSAIASLSFYIFLKHMHFLIYSLFTISNIIYQSYFFGFFYELNLYNIINEDVIYIMANLVVFFLGIFPIIFFKLKKDEYKILVYILKSCFVLLFVFILLYFTGIIHTQSNFSILIYNIVFFTLLLISIRTFIDKKQGSSFYLLANIIVFFSTAYAMMNYSGVFAQPTYFGYFCSIFAATLQDLFLGLAIVQITYKIKKDNDKKSELLNEYSKISFIGQTMVNISHQWKTPINNIYNSINHIEIAREFNDKNINKIIDKNISNIKQNTIYLKDTATKQLNFYKEKVNIEKINVYSEINYVIELIESEFSKNHIKVKLDCDKTLNILIEKNYFLNILMVLLENSFKIFEKRAIKNPLISIKVEEQNNLILYFEDNGGGVSKDFISKIFKKDYSSLSSTGIGLYLAKKIIEHKLKGKISAQNTGDGICFKLII
ncbi:sensor histidine kinase [Arcobacter sp. LA11]|uniref:sensor histidine kinase n=1 Tax=Arcobacter sp. LA11 TaxID=1898176 RepID=UPI0009326A3C|nr:sensor histidine kinase [Arcobacter sp. LA11]